MRKIKSEIIINAIENLCAETNFKLPADVLKSLEQNIVLEKDTAKDILKEIIENADIARKEQIPLCQDTGTANFFIKLGRDTEIENGDIYAAVNKGVSLGYTNSYLRKSVASNPLERKNTKDNTPANIYIDLVSGDKIEITFLPKGGGSENASALKMLVPSVGWDGIREFVLSAVDDKGRNACPPLVVGIGIGGDFASVGLMSKKALLREIGSENKNVFYVGKEIELLNDINKLNIGPMGMGGKTTALAVFIEAKPVHIASLPVAVNIQCHSCRRKTVMI
ncbi:fumarate hydratase [Endomicrobiia bacterium]|uniref:fumarate hydratase n=1 Tax=Endomicrobium trichonymphae TaxID=1408204 RepID=UPI000865FF8D|nr:fumarate hydratase [Candidatus Endomicrobium trichonymphae]GHT06296.1 fumarate hydratase [Endomicrobiia bacterium]BAV58842.1 fumarate hydratase (fumarase) subunit alpha [Candidatus Endomicrobium trichonymphae]GHT08778.1 fumarate hydratase [Endomicrobiia bacterium]GHT12392.1 fumarate hydratase [Endomicrobiia bacterium]GHT17535.1 fumarate hydratase [Endomicrobiia bacterium]